MAQAIMNPEEVRRFAAGVETFQHGHAAARVVAAKSRFSALGETWQDAEHEKFAGEFVTTMKAIKRFMEMSEQHTPFLLRKAQRIEEYLRTSAQIKNHQSWPTKPASRISTPSSPSAPR
jgi:hypothetical protein